VNQRIDDLRDEIEVRFHCRAEHTDSTPVVHLQPGGSAWRGVVETFNLVGHVSASRCFAWTETSGPFPRHVLVLEQAAANSPHEAVAKELKQRSALFSRPA
jgi:hypothetical protein